MKKRNKNKKRRSIFLRHLTEKTKKPKPYRIAMSIVSILQQRSSTMHTLHAAPGIGQYRQNLYVAPRRHDHLQVNRTRAQRPLLGILRASISPDDSWCVTPLVSVDNESNDKYTVVNIEILDYPGLMRVIAWCLNALDVVADHATMHTDDENVAYNSFWVRTISGKKLSTSAAKTVVERLSDYLAYCSPKPEDEMQTEFILGPITISNSEHPQYTVLSVEESSRTPGQMLTIASILSGLNIRIMEGLIQGSDSFGGETMTNNSLMFSYKGTGRLFTFCICMPDGNKFDAESCKSMLYTLGIGLGLSSQKFPLSPPNRDIRTAQNLSMCSE